MISSDFDYTRFTPRDNTANGWNLFKSSYKNIRFALPTSQTLVVTEEDVGNLAGIAFRIYGDVSLWRVILAFNGLQDAIQDMYPGQILKLPSKSDIISYLNAPIASQQNTFTI
jgi:hypothetical protein